MAAMRQVADPHRALQANQTTPVIITGGAPLDPIKLAPIAGAASAEFDADLIRLEFEPGREAEGPSGLSWGCTGTRSSTSRPTAWSGPIPAAGHSYLPAKAGRWD